MAKLVDESDFERPKGIQEITVEKYSNKLPGTNSKELVKDIFASWQVPTERDNINSIFKINRSNNLIATDSTPAELIEEKVFTNLHNEWGDDWKRYPNWESPVRAWAEANGHSLPPSEKDNSYSELPIINITSPTNNQTITKATNLTVSTNSSHGISSVTYYLDDKEIGSTSSAPYSMSLDPTKYSNGSHTLSVKLSDSNGVTARNNITIKIAVPTPATPVPVKTPIKITPTPVATSTS